MNSVIVTRGHARCYRLLPMATKGDEAAQLQTPEELQAIDERRNVPVEVWPPDLCCSPLAQCQFRGPYWEEKGYWAELLGQRGFRLKP